MSSEATLMHESIFSPLRVLFFTKESRNEAGSCFMRLVLLRNEAGS